MPPDRMLNKVYRGAETKLLLTVALSMILRRFSLNICGFHTKFDEGGMLNLASQ